MKTYLLESNLTSWAIEAPDQLTAACAWVRTAMRDEDDGKAALVKVRDVGGGHDQYPFKGLTGMDLAGFMSKHRDAIEIAAKTVRPVGCHERRLLRAEAKLARQSECIGYLEGTLRSIATALAEVVATTGLGDSDQLSRLRARALNALGEVAERTAA